MTIERLCPNFHYIPVISDPDKEPMPWQGYTGFVQEIWKKGVIQDAWGSKITSENTRIFLCGHPEMIKEMVALLTESGFKEHTSLDPGTIHLEKFW
jgi:ferredoxin--NADP+ reductase